MFGYIRPYRPELKCKDFDLYRETYCGLCCTLRQRYGLLAPMFLSYDLTFLALLLEESQDFYTSCKGRCHGNIFCKKSRTMPSDALDRCADITVILTWHQLKDTIADDGFLKRCSARILKLFLKSSYKKAQERLPQFAEKTAQSLAKLQELEAKKCSSIDQVADCFAVILQETLTENLDVSQRRCFRQLLYHVGRWIYLIDARDDFEEDKKTSAFNPFLYRYGEKIDQISLEETLNQSIYMAKSALVFLDFGIRTAVIENIFLFGMPVVQYSVLHDHWQQDKKQKIWRKRP